MINQLSYPKRVYSKIKSCTGLCIGLDPSREQLLSWGLSDDLSGLQIFCNRMITVCIESGIAFAKPQSAFFERFNWEGIRILTETNQALRRAGIFTILDCKRGDIGSTALAYAQAYLSENDFSKYDAITVNPFLGYESQQPFFEILKTTNVGIFIVIRSSNADSHYIQEAIVEGNSSVAIWLAEQIQKVNVSIYGKDQLGSVGAVVGATLNSLTPLLDAMPSSFFLCPGIGAQGALIEDAVANFKAYRHQCIFPISRGITLGVSSEKELIDKVKKTQYSLRSCVAAISILSGDIKS